MVQLNRLIIAVTALTTLGVAGCSSTTKEWQAKKQRTVFSVAHKQVGDEPVYNRLRWTHLPSTLPSESLPNKVGPSIMPVFHLHLKNDSLDKAAQALASTARYKSYCASTIASKKITLERLGTIDELAVELEKAAGVKVVVDHETKEVRLLANSVDPKLLPEASKDSAKANEAGLNEKVTNEHRSNNERKTL